MTPAQAFAPAPAPRTYAPSALPSRAALALERMAWRDLLRTFVDGGTPDLDALIGWEFRGINRFQLDFIPRLTGIKKFLKGFERRDGRIMGYNRAVARNALDGRWHVGDKKFGFYAVHDVDPTARDNKFLHAVLLDYSKGDNKPYDLSRNLRDYLVQVDPANPDLYLGIAYYALGPVRYGPSNFFILERFALAPHPGARP